MADPVRVVGLEHAVEPVEVEIRGVAQVEEDSKTYAAELIRHPELLYFWGLTTTRWRENITSIVRKERNWG